MRCWDGKGYPCPNQAEYRLLDENGKVIPGAGMCCQHVQEVLDEYARIGWRWSAVPVDEFGNVVTND